MGYIRRVDRSATVGFCPTAPYMAAGSAASTIDMNFSSSSVLEVFRLDFASTPSELPCAGTPAAASERFNRVSWGKTGVGTNLYPLGLVAGGLEDGTVHIWDPNKIIQGADTTRSTVTKLKKHKGAVRALEFNGTTTHILASGSTESEVLLWDLTRASIPAFMPPLKDPTANVANEADITFISWNQKVQHILASCTTSGRTVVWDIRRHKPVANLVDLNSQRRCSVLQWNPEVATQVIVASDDDRSPTMQLWDLRNSVSPLKEFVGHAKGVKGMSWCPHDPYLLLSCATDGRTFCWDVTKAEVIGEMPSTGNWHLDVQWSPTSPGIFSLASFDGTVGISSLQSFMGPPVDDQSYAQYGQQAPPGPLKRAPAWLKRPAGVSFGFGGKLVSFTHKSTTGQDPNTGQTVQMEKADLTVQQVTTKGEDIPKSEEFSQVMRSGDRNEVLTFCENKATKSKGEETETWQFLSMMFSQDAKRELLNHLGFEDALPTPTPAEEETPDAGPPPGLAPVNVAPADNGAGFFDNDHSDFFDKFEDEEEKPKTQAKALSTPEKKEQEPKTLKIEPGAKEDEIQRALMVHNYSAAVDACFEGKRPADALLIAQVGGPDLYAKASKRYMESQPRPFMSILSAVAGNNFHGLVGQRPTKQWRETLAMLVAYVNDTDEWVSLCSELGVRLAQAGLGHASSLCFICAGDVDKAVASWMQSKSTASVAGMQDVIEKAIILGMATQTGSASEGLCHLVHNYSSILAAQGSMEHALEYLNMIPGEASESVNLLRDRIQGTSNASNTGQDSSAMGGYMDNQAGVYDYGAVTSGPPQADPYHQAGYFQPPVPSPQPAYNAGGSGYADAGYNPGFSPAPYQAAPPPAYGGYNPQGQPTMHQPTMHQPAAAAPPPPIPQPQAAPFVPQAPAMPLSPKQFTPTHHSPAEPQPRPAMFVPSAPGPAMGGMGGMGGMPGHPPGVAPQPPSPAKPMSPPAPKGPPAHISIATADTSKVPPNQKPIVTSLTNLFRQCEAAAPAKKREMADTSKKLGMLFWMMNEGELSGDVAQQLLDLARAFDSGDIAKASQIHALLTQNAWTDTSSVWLMALKRLLKIRQMLR